MVAITSDASVQGHSCARRHRRKVAFVVLPDQEHCAGSDWRCEWLRTLDGIYSCGWHGDKLERSKRAHCVPCILNRCGDCLIEGAPPKDSIA
jgi:hypothetical protein